MKKQFIQKLGFIPKENSNNIFIKKFQNNYILEVDFEKEKINYWDKINSWRTTTQNFKDEENWVVFECVNRLLEKWYNPEDLVLEQRFKVWRWAEWGWLDILVKKEWKSFLMIECKTRGAEFEKEFKNMKKDWWQLFTYFQQDRNADYIMLYASNENLEYKNEIIRIEESYKETSNVADFYTRWNKFTKQNGIFDDWVKSYDFESKALTLNDLKDIKESDASFIFNRFLEILRHNTVSDKWNAFNKIFTLFLCKIHDEWTKLIDEELEFQWKEWIDNNISFQTRLTDLYKKWMMEFLSKEITDFSDKQISDEFWYLWEDIRIKILEKFTKIRLQKNNEFAIKEVFDDETFEDNAVVLKEVVELLQNYRVRYTKKQPFLWDFFELLLTTWLKQEAGQFFTPVPIARFICKSIPIKEVIENKIITWDSSDLLPTTIDYAAWSGHFLTESMEEIQNIINNIDTSKLRPNVKKELDKRQATAFDWAYDYMYWIEKDYRLVKTAKVGCYLHGDWIATVIHGDWLDSFEFSKTYKDKLKKFNPEDKQENAQFDFVLSNPPYSVSAFKWNLKKEQAENDFALYNSLTDNSSEIEALFIERTAQLLKEWWIAWIVLPSSILSNTWIYTKAREIILKYFEIIAITELGSGTFMATWTNTVTLFLRKRNKFFAKNLEASVSKFFTNLQDVVLNGIEKPVSKYVSEVWEWVSFENYISLLQKNPVENIKNHEIFKDYQNKIKLTKKSEEDKQKEFFEKVIEIEKEKLFYFVLTYSQKLVLVKTWEKNIEKEFLGYKFSEAKWNSWIHPIYWWKKIDDCTKLFDPESLNNPEKASTYIYESFLNNHSREIHEDLKNHIFRTNVSDLLTFDRVDFEKTISLNLKKKVKIESKWEIKKLWEICEVKIWWTPSRSNYEYWENWDNLWVSISEMDWWIINDTKEKINDLWIKKSNVKLIKSGTTLLSFKLSIWKIAIAWKDLYTNEAIAWLCLENEEKVLNKYLFDLFNSKFIDLEKWNFNTFWKSLNSTFLKDEVLIPFPPIETQKQIVWEIEVLEKIEEENLEKIWEFEGKIKDLILNSGWEIKKLWEICDIKSWGTPSRKEPKYWNWNINWLTSEVCKNWFVYDNQVKEKITEEWLKKSSAQLLKKESVLIALVWATIWKIWFLTFESTTNQNISWLYPLSLNQLLPKFLYYSCIQLYPEFGYRWWDFKMANLWFIKNLKIPLPSLEIQKQIVSEIELLEKEIESLKYINKNIPEKKKEILKNYL